MTSNNRPRPRGETKFPAITRHSESLDVTREHLWQVLTGRRQSKSLLSRYKTLLRTEGRTIPADLKGRAA